MIRALIKDLGLGLAFAMMFVATAQSASVLGYNDILGKWCGASNNPNWTNMLFARDALTITHLPQKKTTVFKVDRYEFTDTMVMIYYRPAASVPPPFSGKKTFKAIYSDFSSDRKTMS